MRPLSNVQVLRGMAASLVVGFHVWEELAERHIPNAWPSMTAGAFGVDIFFVISGFIMVYATAPAFGSYAAVPTFFLRRIARIAPLYWAVTTAYILFLVATRRDPGYSSPYLLASYLFVPYPQPGNGDYLPAYSLGWTLEYEMFFYVCFAGVIALRRRIAVPGLSVGLTVLVVVGMLVPLPWPYEFWFRTQILEFVFGMLLAEAYLRGSRLPGGLCLTLALAAFSAVLVATPSIDSWFIYRGLVWGLPGAALMAAAVFHVPVRSGIVRRALERLGDASYSLYLVHYLVFALVARAAEHLVKHPERISPVLYATLLVVGSVGTALLTYRFFEQPLTRALQSRIPFARNRF